MGNSPGRILWDLDLGSKFLGQDSEMTLPRGSVKDLPFSLKKSWQLVCLRTARSLLQTLRRRLSQNPSPDRSRSQFCSDPLSSKSFEAVALLVAFPCRNPPRLGTFTARNRTSKRLPDFPNQGGEIRVPVPRPPQNLKKCPVQMILLTFQDIPMYQGGQKIKKMPSSRYPFEDFT